MWILTYAPPSKRGNINFYVREVLFFGYFCRVKREAFIIVLSLFEHIAIQQKHKNSKKTHTKALLSPITILVYHSPTSKDVSDENVVHLSSSSFPPIAGLFHVGVQLHRYSLSSYERICPGKKQ